MKQFKSDISGKHFPVEERVSGGSIRESLLKCIQSEHPDFTVRNHLSRNELNQFRARFISDYLSAELGELTMLEKTVLKAMSEGASLTESLGNDGPDSSATLGQRLADKVASFGGSWGFIIAFGSFLAIWILVNVFFLANKGFDPYPFILLNLILSCVAAIQAPVIMMSQNRQEEKDRERARKDYMINLKSELEIRILHEKLDHLIIHQQQELLEVQRVQIDMMNDIMSRLETNRKGE